MKLKVFFGHRLDWSLIFKETFEVGSNVGGSVSVAVQKEHTVSLCATP